MKQQANIQTELIDISHIIAEIPFVATYTIPENYFNQLPLLILGKCNTAIYTVPDNYFNTLSTAILNKIEIETDALPAIFNNISKENVYTTPEAYFNTINTIPTPVVNIQKNKKTKTWYYLAAACFTGIIALVAFQFINNTKPTSNVNSDRIIAGTNMSYNQIVNMNVDAAIDSLNNDDVNNYLCENGLIACTDTKANDEKLQTEIEELNITEEELNDFIDASN
jgi:hypothetical protein